MIKNSIATTSGLFTGVESGSQVNGDGVFVGGSCRKVEALSALVTVDAETNTMTVTPKWEVSNDDSTYVTAANANNAANVVLATGTAGADASVSRVISAPDTVYGWRFARMSLLVGVATGTSSDSYSIAYNYRQLTVADQP